MSVHVWLSNGAEVEIEDVVSATIEPSPVGLGITEVWLICRDAHGHESRSSSGQAWRAIT